MTNENYCAICDGTQSKKNEDKINVPIGHEEKEEISLAVLLALVPVLTMTLFNLMGLI